MKGTRPFTAEQAAALLDVELPQVTILLEAGVLRGLQAGATGLWLVEATSLEEPGWEECQRWSKSEPFRGLKIEPL